MPQLTWAQFVAQVRIFLTVDSNRIGATDYVTELIKLGAVEVQDSLEFYRIGHTATWEADDVERDGFASSVELPSGAYLRELYHLKLGEACLERPLYWYPYSNKRDLTCGMVSISRAFRFTTDPQGRKLWVYPAITPGYAIKLDYDGVRDDFADADLVPFDKKVAKVVADFVMAEVARKVDGDLAASASYSASYRSGIRKLFIDTRDRLMESAGNDSKAGCVPGTTCVSAGLCVPCSAAPCVNPTELPQLEWVMFGDSGDPASAADTTELAAAVRALNPSLIVHLGDANYPSGSSVTLGDNFVRHFWSWIQAGEIFVSYGEVDLATNYGDPLSGILLAQQAAIGASNITDRKLWFRLVRGEVEFFVLNSGLDDDDAYAVSGAILDDQKAWLEAALADSTATWKVVVCHRPPYTSDSVHGPGLEVMRWPFLEWGANVVVSAHAHDYERLLVDGMHYIVCGLGGSARTTTTLNPVLSGSQFRWSADIGFLRCTASAEQLQISLVHGRTGAVIDRLVLVPGTSAGGESVDIVSTPTFTSVDAQAPVETPTFTSEDAAEAYDIVTLPDGFTPEIVLDAETIAGDFLIKEASYYTLNALWIISADSPAPNTFEVSVDGGPFTPVESFEGGLFDQQDENGNFYHLVETAPALTGVTIPLRYYEFLTTTGSEVILRVT